MEINVAEKLGIDAQTVMTGRGCAIGQSGSGKSFLAGVIAEELCKLNMPFCIIDTEGEYNSLKEISSNIITVGGEHGDVSLDVEFSKLFSASISNDVPIILDLSDVSDKNETAQKALSALYNIEDKVRKPYLIIIEEADKFTPQVTSKKLNIIEEISVRGRKRGIGLFITTQRPANISKNVLAQCSYGFIGKLTIENDLNALRILFNSNEKLTSITRLKVGEFIPFGLPTDSSFKVRPREVEHIGTTPSIESYKPSSSKISSILKELKTGGKTDNTKSAKKTPSNTSTISILQPSFPEDQVKAYAERIAKRKFIMFGDITESIDPIELKYMPISMFNLRFPKGRNEYIEYTCMLNSRSELVKLDRGVKVLRAENEPKEALSNYRKYLSKEDYDTSEIKVSNEDLLAQITEKRAKKNIERFFPDAIIVDFRLIFMPVYRIILRRDNKVRIFGIDAIYGKKIDL